MPIRAKENLIGAWALLLGVILALVGGIVLSFGYSINPIILAILTLSGIVAGFSVNVNENGGSTFLMAAVSLVIVSFAGIQSATTLAGTRFADVQIIGIQVGRIMSSTLSGLLFILIPSTIIVAIKSVFSIAQR